MRFLIGLHDYFYKINYFDSNFNDSSVFTYSIETGILSIQSEKSIL
jgi:hypothetical protein